MSITKEPFGELQDGQAITRFSLINANGVSVSIINYGGIITSITTPDSNGIPGDIVLGFDSMDGYTSRLYHTKRPYFGAIIGRYANRIANGKFTLDGITYNLSTNNGNNHIHGGEVGFDKVVWEAEEVNKNGRRALKLSYLSKNGEEGYPGNLQVAVFYSLSEANELQIDYEAVTDNPTPVALTNHSYFNLTGGKNPDVLGHEIKINADQYLAINEQYIPTGAFLQVKETALDFREPHTVGSRIADLQTSGYAHTYVLNKKGGGMSWAATVYDPVSGREMQVYTTEPGLIFYTGDFLDGSLVGKNGQTYTTRSGLALETQHYPDSPNHFKFLSTILRPGEIFTSSTIYKFSVRDLN